MLRYITSEKVWRKFRAIFRHSAPPFTGHYNEWNAKRFQFITMLMDCQSFENLKVLELSSGHANLGKFFFLNGADVTCTDGRPEHLKLISYNFPAIKTIELDLMLEYPRFPKFNIVIHFGVLYHLSEPITHLKDFLLKQDFDHLFLETEVANYPDENFVLRIKESGYDQGISGLGGRPTSRAIEKVLSDLCLNWERHDTTFLNVTPHDYSWQETETPETYRVGLRRFYHVSKISSG